MKLITLIDSEFQNMNKEAAFISKIIDKKGNNPIDEISLRACALSMTAIYNGIEKILVQILLTKEIKIKESFSWHTEVLKSAMNEKIITEATQKELVGFLSFRHFIRHAYSFEINPSTVEPILNKVQAITDIFQKEIESILVEILNNE